MVVSRDVIIIEPTYNGHENKNKNYFDANYC